ncbi:uncharacterized protein LOC135461662 [Liolophura sinensis]|uniref:uncharacterized protein LOC135461662 n=1 Tax=Liolophura sinensis TaxID=3198878 RepID=UPI003159110A
MGNAKSSGEFGADVSRHDVTMKVLAAQKGERVFSCSYNKWVSKGKYTSGFGDFTDYTTCREAHRRQGVLVKPDCSEGRYFIHNFKNATQVIVLDRQSWWSAMISLPRVSVPMNTTPSWLYSDLRAALYSKQDGTIIGFHDGLAILQVIFDRNLQTPIFYILDLEARKCVGHFKIDYIRRQWFECYISPGKRRILLRPDHLTRILQAGSSYEPDMVTLDPGLDINVQDVDPQFRRRALTFNPNLGDDDVIFANGRVIQFYSLESKEVWKNEGPYELPASMQQIRSSRSGDYLAARCVSPVHSKEYDINVVVIFDFVKLNLLLKIDAKGSYWPVSEVINLQVFPKFSAGESSVAIMKNRTAKRKVYVYKLPVVEMKLKNLCRRVILQLVSFKECERLPLPEQIIKFLQWKRE